MSRPVPSASGVVREWAAREPDRICLTFHGGGATEPLTYRMLAEQAARYAGLYRARGLRAGDPVVLFADSTAAFVAAFLERQASVRRPRAFDGGEQRPQREQPGHLSGGPARGGHPARARQSARHRTRAPRQEIRFLSLAGVGLRAREIV